MPVPTLTTEQRSAALEKATKARRARAELKESLKAGEVSLVEVVNRADTDDTVGKMKVTDLLSSLPKVGKARAAAIMEEIGIADSRRIRGLGRQQRTELLARFRLSA
jgi:hypothetical protein